MVLLGGGQQAGLARPLGVFERRPAGKTVTAHPRLCVLEPLQRLWARRRARLGQAVRETPLLGDPATALFHARGPGAHGGALGLERGTRVWRGDQPLEGTLGIRGVVFRVASAPGRARLRRRRRVDGPQDQNVVARARRDQRSGRQLHTHRDEAALAALPQPLGPLVRTLWPVGPHADLARVTPPAGCRPTSCWRSAQSMPTKAAEGTAVVSFMMYPPEGRE